MRQRLFEADHVLAGPFIEAVTDYGAGGEVVRSKTDGRIAHTDLTGLPDPKLGMDLHGDASHVRGCVDVGHVFPPPLGRFRMTLPPVLTVNQADAACCVSTSIQARQKSGRSSGFREVTSPRSTTTEASS